MGVVYRARDEKLHRVVALKCLSHDEKANISRRRLLMREARCASALNHPNICTIYSVDERDEQLFIAMEFLAGQTQSAEDSTRRSPQQMHVV